MLQQGDTVGDIAGFRQRIALAQQSGPALGGVAHCG
jgi:hypothetical protein